MHLIPIIIPAGYSNGVELLDERLVFQDRPSRYPHKPGPRPRRSSPGYSGYELRKLRAQRGVGQVRNGLNGKVFPYPAPFRR